VTGKKQSVIFPAHWTNAAAADAFVLTQCQQTGYFSACAGKLLQKAGIALFSAKKHPLPA
jgi:hypothetical protein